MQTKTITNTSSNFLNNQNYILGNFEKKKILNKFFAYKNWYNLLNILDYISYFANNYLKYIIVFVLYLTIIYVEKDRNFLFLLISFWVLIIWLLITKYLIPKTDKNYITSIWDFFINIYAWMSDWNSFVFQKVVNSFYFSECLLYLFIK